MYTKLLVNHMQYLSILSTFDINSPESLEGLYTIQKASAGNLGLSNSFECLVYGGSNAAPRYLRFGRPPSSTCPPPLKPTLIHSPFLLPSRGGGFAERLCVRPAHSPLPPPPDPSTDANGESSLCGRPYMAPGCALWVWL